MKDKRSQEKKGVRLSVPNKSPWAILISDTEEKVKEAKQRVTELELALETFKRQEKEGTPWPLKPTTQN